MIVQRPPGFIEPCLPSKVTRPPSGPLWVHEIKYDGYRLVVGPVMQKQKYAALTGELGFVDAMLCVFGEADVLARRSRSTNPYCG